MNPTAERALLSGAKASESENLAMFLIAVFLAFPWSEQFDGVC
jgi:hypothetical protein